VRLRLHPVSQVGGLSLALALAACGSSPSAKFHPGSDGDGGSGSGDGGASPPGDGSILQLPDSGGGGSGGDGGDGGSGVCSGLSCQIHSCATGSTTISGTIYDPAVVNPLYNIVAYIPNTTPQPFPAGAACAPCDALYTGDPIATALTDASGHFTIPNAPDGTNIPLVIQVGKWRKQITIPTVTMCQDNPQPDKSLSLPKNQTEGDIPLIAISTGGSDTLECLLTRIGLDAAEYSPAGGGTGRIQIFQGGAGHAGQNGTAPNTAPPGPESYKALWDSSADLLKYDIVLLSCEGEETKDGVGTGAAETQVPLTAADQDALQDYANGGGRVFASHFHYAWFSDTLSAGPNTGPFGADNLATWTPGTNDMNTINANIEQTLPGGGMFPKGVALFTWLGNVGALTNTELPIQEAKHNADVGIANTLSTPWIVADNKATPPGATEYFSFDTPVGAAADKVCGRIVYSDLHVGAASGDQPAMPVPQECTVAKLSPQEDALEFMLFDLSSCVTPNSVIPMPPPTTPK
jgi:hypothetical protein